MPRQGQGAQSHYRGKSRGLRGANSQIHPDPSRHHFIKKAEKGKYWFSSVISAIIRKKQGFWDSLLVILLSLFLLYFPFKLVVMRPSIDRGGFVHHKSYKKKRAAINHYQFYEGCIPGGLDRGKCQRTERKESLCSSLSASLNSQ